MAVAQFNTFGWRCRALQRTAPCLGRIRCPVCSAAPDDKIDIKLIVIEIRIQQALCSTPCAGARSRSCGC